MASKHKPLIIDFETRSHADIKLVGTYNYSIHPSTQILSLVYKFLGEKKVNIWEPLRIKNKFIPIPDIIKKHRGLIISHNWVFEYCIIKDHLLDQLPIIARKHYSNYLNYKCTLARSGRWGLPLSLEKAGRAINLKEQKESELGNKVLRNVHKLKEGRFISISDIEKEIWNDLIKYNKQDVIVTEQIYKKLPEFCNFEKKNFEQYQKSNLRGFRIDKTSLKKIYKAFIEHTKRAEKKAIKLCGLTKGKKLVVRSPKAFKDWINKRLPFLFQILDAQAATIENLLLKLKIKSEVTKACELRQILSPSAPKKFIAAINQMDSAGILRFQTQYFGSHTGREAGRGMQPLNLYKDCVPENEFNKELKKFISARGDIRKAAKFIRPLIIPTKKRFIVSDFAQAELRILLWLAGHHKELKTLALGGDLYKEFASKIYGVDILNVNKIQRFVGKTSVLGLGYGMGKVKFYRMLLVILNDATQVFAGNVVESYRSIFFRVTKLWRSYEAAFFSKNPVKVGPIQFYNKGKSKRIILPSGREMNYLKPICKYDKDGRKNISYLGARGREHIWGGVLVENVVQAICRDLLVMAVDSIENDLKMPVVLHIYDEVIVETDKFDKETIKKFNTIMEKTHDWAVWDNIPLPMACETVIRKRFGK